MRREGRPEVTRPGVASPLCEAGPLGPHEMSLSVVILESLFYVLGAFSLKVFSLHENTFWLMVEVF